MSRRYRHRGWLDRRRPRVLDVAPGLVHESGPVRDAGWVPDRVAVMAHWSTDPVPSRSVVTMLRALDSAGYETVLVSAADAVGPIGRVCTWAPGAPALPEATTVLRRANVGYDFGSWAVVLATFQGVRRAGRVLLVNDSLIGPFASLAPILADFEASSTPVWGLSGSQQHRPHLQSFFVGFRDGVLDAPAMRAFWSDVRAESAKAKFVRFAELGLSEALDEAGIPWQAMLPAGRAGRANPTLDVDAGLPHGEFPFVKANAAGLVDQVGVLAPGEGWVGPAGGPPRPASMSAGQRIRFAVAVEGVPGLVAGGFGGLLGRRRP